MYGMERSTRLSNEQIGRSGGLEVNSAAAAADSHIVPIPRWEQQLSVRAFVVAFFLGVLLTFIVMKSNLTVGMVSSVPVPAGLLGFFFVKTWIKIANKSGLLQHYPFTRQENTVIQTCVVAISGLAFSGGFGTYVLGMSEVIAKQCDETNDSNNIKNPSLGWMIGFLFCVSFLGIICVLPLRKIMIIDFKLVYPSGTATAHLINSIHTPDHDYEGTEQAKKQVKILGKFFSFSFLWNFFQWFFTGGDDCGFRSFPLLGLKAYQNSFYFDFSTTYVGVGMISSHLVNISFLLGGILSWGIMWPLIENKKGNWYPADLDHEPLSLHGIQGYRVFIPIAMILGDGLYNFFKILGHVLSRLYCDFILDKRIRSFSSPVVNNNIPSLTTGQTQPQEVAKSYEEQLRTQIFLRDDIPNCFPVVFYCSIAVISSAVLPHIFPQLRWYYIVVIYVVAPILAFCNAYGYGLTDWNMQSTYGKLAMFTMGAWAGASHGHGGVLAGLAACGVMMNIVSTASDLMQDFKTGYMTLTSPRSMFVSQVIGTAMGCVISPCVFLLIFNANKDILGTKDSEYPATFAKMYRNMSILGAKGFSSLPKHCLTLCYVFFVVAVAVNALRDLVGARLAKYIPLPMVMAIPFYLGTYYGIDMCVGSLILFFWQKVNRGNADEFGPAVASGLICGYGLWTFPSSLLSVAGIKPPICMKFISRKTNLEIFT